MDGEFAHLERYGITLRRIRMLRGPNIYAYKPVLHAVVDIGPYEERPSNSFPGFVDRMLAWLPTIETHECGLQRPGGFVERLRTGTYLAHILEHVTIELQSLMDFDVTFGRARSTGEPGVYNIVVAYREEEPARAAFACATRLVLAAMHDEPFDIEQELEHLREIADSYRIGPSTGSIVKAARARKIPVLRLTPTGSLIQLGYGIYQKRIRAAETSNTSSIAVGICQEKPLTNEMLRAVGVPVPEGRTVHSADEAWEVAQFIGLPVVLKPDAGNQGKGVSVNLHTEQEIREAYEIAGSYGDVLVEQYIEGHDYRLLVVGGKLVAAARRDPAQVTGDGRRTVRELVEEVNKDPRRRPGHSSSLTRIRLDDAARLVLSQQGMTFDSVPEAGQVVRLRQNGNLSTGGTATDVTDDVHPSNARMAELAAQIVALDIAGIDIICKDIRRPLSEQRGAIVEVNAAPGLRMHIQPTNGQPRDVGEPIVRMLYPEGAPSRIPIVAVTGTNGKTTVSRLIAHIYSTAHKLVGLTCTDGTYIGGERIMTGDCSGPRSARAILLHPQVEAAVLETARGGILREGLGFDWCRVGVVTNISSDHLGLGGVETLEDLAQVKQVVVESVARDGAAVLNADDPLVAEMAAATDAEVIYFSRNAANPIIASHVASGGRAVFVDKDAIMLGIGQERVPLVELERIAFSAGGRIGFQVSNALAAAAAAWAAGLNPALIVRALSTFQSDEAMAPGRFNRMDLQGVELIVDYGHNAGAMQALGEAITALGKRRTVMVMGLPGDRRNEDLRATIEASVPFVDAYVLHDLMDRRGRAENEVPQLLQQTVAERVPSQIVASQEEGVIRGWSMVKPGDRIVIIADEVDDALKIVHSLAASVTDEAACYGLNTLKALERGG